MMVTELPVGTGLDTLLRITAVTSAKLELALPVLGARVTNNAVVVGACDSSYVSDARHLNTSIMLCCGIF